MGGISKKANGNNQTQVKTSTGIWTADHNAQNRPIRFARENADGTRTVITTAYDYLGRRAWKKVETIDTDPETGEETATVTLHQRYIYRGYLQVAACDLTRGGIPVCGSSSGIQRSQRPRARWLFKETEHGMPTVGA